MKLLLVKSRLLFAVVFSSQDEIVDEPFTHPGGLLFDEFCESLVRLAYSLLIEFENSRVKSAEDANNSKCGSGALETFCA